MAKWIKKHVLPICPECESEVPFNAVLYGETGGVEWPCYRCQTQTLLEEVAFEAKLAIMKGAQMPRLQATMNKLWKMSRGKFGVQS